MNSCHFGAVCFLWVSLVVPQHSWLPSPWFFQLVCSRVLSLPLPRPGLSPSHRHRSLQLSTSMNSCPVQAAQSPPEHTGGTPCSSQKSAICKKRFSIWEVTSNLKKAEKWEWEEHVCCSLNLNAQRMQRGLGWVLKHYFKILPSDPDNSSPCWLRVSAVPPALEPAAGTGSCWWTCHAFFMGKVLETPEPATATLRRAIPTWLAGLYPKKQMALEQNLIFCFELRIFRTSCQQSAQWV